MTPTPELLKAAPTVVEDHGLPGPSAGTPTLGARYFRAVRQRLGAIALFVGVLTVAAGGIAFILPQWFTAETTLLPPAEGAESLDLMSALVENKTLGRLGLFSATTPSDVYVEILKSRRLREPLVRDFDLATRYKRNGMERTLKELALHVRISLSPIGVVSIRVEDRDPQRAADMANSLVASLDRFNRESVNTRAKRTREFLEKRLVEAKANLTQAESTLTAYEEKHKVVASSEQTAVGAMADVISRKLSLEVRRSYLSSFVRPGGSTLGQVEAEIGAMDRELAKLPSLKQEGSRLALDAEIQRRVFILLTSQFEEMRVQETRDTPTLTVLDPAIAPEIRSRPRRGLIVVVTAAAALALAAAWVGFKLNDPGSRRGFADA
jgi:tyrosine-protein kinase Etk/Wzc